MHELEKKIVMLLSKPQSKVLDSLSRLISNIFLLAAIWVFIAAYVIKDNFMTGSFICLGLAIVFILHFVISEGIFKFGGKHFYFKRTRPHKAYPEEIKSIGKGFQESSFPSSHMAGMTGGFIVLVYFYKFFWPAALVFIILLSWSRLRNGMHYPSDILAGILLGLAYGYLALWLLGLFFRSIYFYI
jgi:undecaprenyl-diphosphatase